jgi:hypothetical protein
MRNFRKCMFNVSYEFPVTKKKDVVVVGSGPAGCLAALAARRNGADTLLIERESCLGGMMTGGFVNSMLGFRLNKDYVKYVPTSSWETPRLVNGISLEVVNRLQRKCGTLDQGHPGDPSQRELFDPEVMKQVLDEMMEESRVEVLFNTFAFNAVVEDSVMKGVVIANKSGGQVVLADVTVDASGDADIAAAAGVPFLIGREKDGRLHGGSLMMDIGGVDVNKFIAYLKSRPQRTEEESKKFEEEASRLLGGGGTRDTILTLDGKRGWWSMGGVPTRTPWDQVDQIMKEGKVPLRLPGLEYEWLEFVKSGSVPPWLGASRLIYIRAPASIPGRIRHGKLRYDQVRSGVHEAYFDQTNQEEISKAVTWMRKMNNIYLRFFRERIPGYVDAYVIQMQPTVGTRESRRIIGEYTLTEEDCVEGRRFSDVIAKSGHACNVHSVTGVFGENFFLEPKKPFDIPYRCLVPKKIDNLLVAGRPISVTHIAHGATRDEPPCMSTGEAAGTAAALSARIGVAPRELDIRLLQKKLLDQRVLLFLEEEKTKEKEILAYAAPE